ncbi:virulence RhuM family protein [Pseudomonas sp. 2FE]|uniref:virulence RhuM family protein n=1 Tax=Pseudomonas sp. 2FE TaxID=2502190 RepID=UPI0010F8F5A4|nr:virulence RhuM family protein [Pseudomonas sp. 2FE]
MRDLILYTSDDGQVSLQLRAADGTVWLTQLEIAELFANSKQNISLHIRNILAEGELSEATVKDSLTVQTEGSRQVKRLVQLYNLDMTLAVGYRVRSPRGMQFRQWATTQLRELLVKGFVMDDQRLKNPGGWDYFDELLERIREIRASEKRFYQKIRDLYTTAVDYQGSSEAARLFFQKVQNKMLWAVTGHTAAELISQRANPDLPNMGLTTWEGGRVRKKDVSTAKNYLSTDEVRELDRIVVMYLDYADDQARRGKTMTMQDWASKLDAFLSFNERDLLSHAGKVSASVAERLVEALYEQFDANRREAERQAADNADLHSIEQLQQQLPRKRPE